MLTLTGIVGSGAIVRSVEFYLQLIVSLIPRLTVAQSIREMGAPAQNSMDRWLWDLLEWKIDDAAL